MGPSLVGLIATLFVELLVSKRGRSYDHPWYSFSYFIALVDLADWVPATDVNDKC